MQAFNITDYPSVRDAVAAVAEVGGAELRFPAGEYETATVRLPSNTHLVFEEGSVLRAAQTGYDEPEDNPWDEYQDFGHSHFNNSMLIADGVENVKLSGCGIISGEGRLVSGDGASGGIGNKLIVFKECRNVCVSGLHLREGGHFTILANDVDGLTLSNIRVEGTRDGANIIGCRNVVIRDSFFSGNDDALVFKSDYALGRAVTSENVEVKNCTLHSNCNAIQFGTETTGLFRNMQFENIHCMRGSKAAIGILSCDGSVVEDISFKNILMEVCASFFFLKIADRGRRPGYQQGVDTGSIRSISFENIRGRGPMTWRGHDVTPTIMGMPHRPIEDISFKNVHLQVPGGHPPEHSEVQVEDTGFFRARFETDLHPSYGWWMRDVKNVSFENCSVKATEPDGRPAVVVEGGENVTFDGQVVQDRLPKLCNC